VGKKPGTAALVVAVCGGDTCKEGKSKKVRARLEALIEARGLNGNVKVKKTSCQKRCSKGPVVRVGDALVEGVKPKDAGRLLNRALAAMPSGKAARGKKRGKKT